MTLAIVAHVDSIEKHPNADRLEVLTVRWLKDGQLGHHAVVTGRHYRVGQLGVLILPPAKLPGWLAEDLWLFGSERAKQLPLFEVRAMQIRGEWSAGLFSGQVYRKDRDDPRSAERFAAQQRMAGAKVTDDDWIVWPAWRDEWAIGDDVAGALGITA